MKIDIYQVDAFTNQIFAGNPASVCPLEYWLDTDKLQKIAMENCVAETAFFVRKGTGYEIRWFTPEIEMDLCGHATLAAAHVITRHLGNSAKNLTFHSKSGALEVTVEKDAFHLNFPSRPPKEATAPSAILDAINIKPMKVLKSRDLLLVFENEKMIRDLVVDREALDKINLDPGGVIVTAKGDTVDFVSRFFTPQASILEDPVTGSAHCSLIPFWSQILDKNKMTALQLSARQGILQCINLESRVIISGQAITYLIGQIFI